MDGLLAKNNLNKIQNTKSETATVGGVLNNGKKSDMQVRTSNCYVRMQYWKKLKIFFLHD